jgi:hypothetical protein
LRRWTFRGAEVNRIIQLLPLAVVLTGGISTVPGSPEKEFLTDKEIEKIQDVREIAGRIRIYLDAAALRLKTTEDRLLGKEVQTGDSLEFFTPEDMLDGYYRILNSVMLNLEDAYQKAGPYRTRVGIALKSLKESTENALKDLEILKKMAEEKKKEELWNLVNKAIDITNGAHEGAVLGLSKQSSSPEKK